MFRVFALFFITLLCNLASAGAKIPSQTGSNDSILIYIRDDVYEDYLEFVADREITSITNFTGKTIRRDVVDMIIAQQALKLGGFNYEFSYAPGKVNFRNTKLLEIGKLLISFDSYWLSDAEPLAENVFISSPVIRRGEYIAGIYTSPNNKAMLAVQQLEDLANFTAVSTPKWRTDWRTLQQLPLKELVRDDEWLSMARMVNIGWVDFMLMPFHSTPDQVFTLDNIKLMPVPNVAVVMDDSRHFVISKSHPQGEAAKAAIDRGLAKLRAENRIIKAYTDAKFFIDTSQIKILNDKIITNNIDLSQIQ